MNIIKELWHGNIIPQEDKKNNTKEMKELLGYIARHTHSKGILPSEEMKLTEDSKRNNQSQTTPRAAKDLRQNVHSRAKRAIRKAP